MDTEQEEIIQMLMREIRKLLVEDDFSQCTNCRVARVQHPKENGGKGAGRFFIKTGCDNFEVRPMNVMLPGDTVRMANFSTTQEGKQFARDLTNFGEVEALKMHPDARIL